MKKMRFEVEFLSDIVLQASSNTEGNVEQLDFIPGSNFLGMVASKYTQFEDSFSMFHSGAVKFGDATLMHQKQCTYAMPLSYFHEKLSPIEIVNHHSIKDFSDFNQLKQVRKGYITEENSRVYVEYNYSQKSAYDSENRRSKDSSMYGYHAINSKTKWQFDISYDESISIKDLELIKKSIVGQKRLGKSKSSQYGLVQIKEVALHVDTVDSAKKEIVLYVKSRIALVDEKGNATLDLVHLFNDLESKQIDYTKCQIRTSSFTPYNRARETKDYERICINKGSVIVLKDIDKASIPSYVGAYLSEGFGEIVVNPLFLSKERFSFKKEQEEETTQNCNIQTKTANFLMQKERQKNEKLILLKEVDTFIDKNLTLYKNITNAQWGNIRSICLSQEDTANKIEAFISDGIKAWKPTQIETLKPKMDDTSFMMLVSMQMPNKQGDTND